MKWTYDGHGNVTKARIYHSDGRIFHYENQKLAYAVWLALPRKTRAAFRGINDPRPVYSHDFVGK